MTELDNKLSIIIPCYNAAVTLKETLQSVFAQDFQNWEAIIVNDGSTDYTEDIALQWVKNDSRFHYFSKPNEGLGKTRNYGITRAQGKYILPLDADNLVMPDFAKNAVGILEAQNVIDVVHGNALFIGEKTGVWNIGTYNIEKMLLDNYIDACAIFRKSTWEQVGGYEENLPYDGLEDWDLWLAFGTIQAKFYFIDSITFQYRVSKNSMIKKFTPEMKLASRSYIAKKYSDLYQFQYCKFVREHDNLASKLTNKRFVLNAFCKTFFGFSILKSTK
ncbi:glycosyltransferase family 2 protein [Flavobacterium sp. SOK18b]|uniref:glycosyltransferase family 2 protein n=1 Tax=Flavobacterium sp. SOK18b TaxID=797900 RepID=UPI0015FBF605|nr:glycosyltransferase [Flavobacterium sp. SOK18b]MBB1192510.1 glycosyltransferase family 2 protein [Flavobacterium sp. SOK18b]